MKANQLISNRTPKSWIVQSNQRVQGGIKQLCPHPATGSEQSAQANHKHQIIYTLNKTAARDASIVQLTDFDFKFNLDMKIYFNFARPV